jgi:hypothetical protein
MQALLPCFAAHLHCHDVGLVELCRSYAPRLQAACQGQCLQPQQVAAGNPAEVIQQAPGEGVNLWGGGSQGYEREHE